VAVPKKGWRKLAIDDSVYYWRASGHEWGLDVVVVTDDAFQRGTTAQQLVFRLDYDHECTPLVGPFDGVSLRQRAAISPAVVRAAIERARIATPPFTGEIGLPDVTLDSSVLDKLQALARSAG
jgi:hypothetical protein